MSSSNSINQLLIQFRRLSGLLMMLLLAACQAETGKSSANTNSESATNKSDTDYDWTGTYMLDDGPVTYTLKLHKRSVDGSYEMQWYDNTDKSDLYKSSIYDAKVHEGTITIRYLNNFQTDAAPLGFKSGDTLFVLCRTNSADSTAWKSFQPANPQHQLQKTSSTY